METHSRARTVFDSWTSKNGNIIWNVFGCAFGSHNYCIKEDGSLMLWFYYTYFLPLAGSQWKIVSTGSGIIWFWRRVQNPEWVQEDLGGGPGTWEEDWKAAMQPYLPCRCTTSFPPEIPSSTIWLPTWNSDTLKSWNPENPAHQRKTHLEDVQGESGCSGS